MTTRHLVRKLLGAVIAAGIATASSPPDRALAGPPSLDALPKNPSPGTLSQPGRVPIEQLPGTKPSVPDAERNVVRLEALAAGVSRVTGELDRAASNANLMLTPEARDALIQEFLRRGAERRAQDVFIVFSPQDASQVVSKLAASSQGGALSAEQVRSTIITLTWDEVLRDLPTDVQGTVKRFDLTFDKVAYERLTEDLKTQSFALAQSGLPSGEIREKNKQYIEAFYSAAPTKHIAPRTYALVKSVVFEPKVLVTIRSEPVGAEVDIHGFPIGKTEIARKPFEAGQTYTFTFRRQNYKTATREFYVAPGEREVTFTEVLLPDAQQ